MGYRLAGYDVIGNLEIDGRINKVYQHNLKPALSYTMDIRDFLQTEIPEELYDLDILDGSPPCTVFTLLKKDRQKKWGQTAEYLEGGRANQRLDDLFFYFIKLAGKLQPKVVVAENVTALQTGAARTIFFQILDAFYDAGYIPECFNLDAQNFGVPQHRERAIFIAQRKDIKKPFTPEFNCKKVVFGDVRTEEGGGEPTPGTKTKYLLDRRKKGDASLKYAKRRELGGKEEFYTAKILYDDKVAPTQLAGNTSSWYRDYDGRRLSMMDKIRIQTFPRDYDFLGVDHTYILGMSVPPLMMAEISNAIYEQILK